MKLENICIKVAETEHEFKQIHQLNYDTFVEEINQHKKNGSKLLIDQFDNENIYYIAKIEDELIGMIAFRDQRPFSLDNKIDNLDALLPKHKSLVEIRLLSIKKAYRHTKVLLLLIQYLIDNNLEKAYDLAVISGILNQQRLYRHMGFLAMGDPVGEETKFQPMYLTKERYLDFTRHLFKPKAKRLNLLPGPVDIAENVTEAFHKVPISHRSELFRTIFNRTRDNLVKLTSAHYVEILTGTGTSANDTVAAQISLLEGKGLILSNGEFGERLFKHADNTKLEYFTLQKKWGERFDLKEIEALITKDDIEWLWFVHHETSTGMLNNLKALSALGLKHDVKICVDVISSLGTEKIDLSSVYLASGVSSKGLASFAGLSIIFYNYCLKGVKQVLPSSINLSVFANAKGIPFTLNSNLLRALDQSLKNFEDFDKRLNSIQKISDHLRIAIEQKGLKVLVDKDFSSASTMTIILNEDRSSRELGERLKDHKILVSFESAYLIKKNWIQLCFMGAKQDEESTKAILDFL